MIKRIQYVLILLASLLLIPGCGLGTSIDNEQESFVTPISELENIENFRQGALAHILEGELNARGKAVGFHYDRLPTKKGKVISGTETDPNEYGVYEAKVEVSGVKKTSNGGRSSFFPKTWDTQQVVDGINEAYDDKNYITGNTYEGFTSEGILIRMYLDQQDLIISAFPIY